MHLGDLVADAPPGGASLSTAIEAVNPIGDPSRGRRLKKVAGWLGGTALVLVLLNLLGVDVRGWISNLWDALVAAE